MLSLDDPRWFELSHAYGSASDIPMLLRQLALSPGPCGPNTEPWFTLWSSLCHQEDVYPASYAATPHIVQIALNCCDPIDFSFFMLPSSIEISRVNGRGPAVPPFLMEPYLDALAKLTDCACVHRGDPWDQDMTLSVAAAQAVAKGHIQTAEALLKLDQDWIDKINDPEQWD